MVTRQDIENHSHAVDPSGYPVRLLDDHTNPYVRTLILPSMIDSNEHPQRADHIQSTWNKLKAQSKRAWEE